MRIGLDCRLAGMTNGGIGRYVSQLVLELSGIKSNVTWVCVFHDQNQVNELWPTVPSNVEVQLEPSRHYTLKEQWRMPEVWDRLKVDLLHVPHFNIPVFYQGKMVMTIHDLLWHHQTGTQVTTLPSWQYAVKYQAYKWLTKQAVQKAERIFVPTRTIAQTVSEYYPFAAEKTNVTYEGIDPIFQNTKPASKSSIAQNWKLDQTKKYLLYVGSLYPHKNVELIVKALPKLAGYELVVVGTRTVFRDRFADSVQRQHLQDRVHLLGRVSDTQLIDLLHFCDSLVQPSFSEGFGLTGVEAIAAGSAVLASDIPVFHEVYETAAEYFDPRSADSFVAAVAQVKRPSQAVRDKLLTKYSWRKMAKQTYQQYLEVLGAATE